MKKFEFLKVYVATYEEWAKSGMFIIITVTTRTEWAKSGPDWDSPSPSINPTLEQATNLILGPFRQFAIHDSPPLIPSSKYKQATMSRTVLCIGQ